MGTAAKKMAQVPGAPSAHTAIGQLGAVGGGGLQTQAANAGNSGQGGGGVGGQGGGGSQATGPGAPIPTTPASQPQAPFGSHYGGDIGYTGGVIGDATNRAAQSFSSTDHLQGATPFWQSPGIQVASQHGYDPGQQFAGQDVTGSLIENNPFVAAAQQNFNSNVLPGIQDQFNTMGLGRSTAAGNAMAHAQASMLEPLYEQAGQFENQRIQRQMDAGQFSAGIGQQDLNRLQGSTESELGRRERSSDAQAQAQQQLFQNMMAMRGQQFQQGEQGAQQLFDMGSQGREYGQQANQSAQQDLLRRMGLSEEAINPFGGISGLLGTTTSGK